MCTRNTRVSSSLFFINRRADSRKAASAHLPAGLGEQQRGAQHRQHAEHALLQQQRSLAPRLRPEGTGGRPPRVSAPEGRSAVPLRRESEFQHAGHLLYSSPAQG